MADFAFQPIMLTDQDLAESVLAGHVTPDRAAALREKQRRLWQPREGDRFAHAGGPYVVNLDAWTRFFQALNRRG